MSSHPGDKPVQRFIACVVGFASMFGFALAAAILALVGMFLWPKSSALDVIAETRGRLAAETRTGQLAQRPVLDPGTASAALAKRVAKTSAVAVPGTPAALQAMQAPAPSATAPKPPAPASATPPVTAPNPPAPATPPVTAPNPPAPATPPVAAPNLPAPAPVPAPATPPATAPKPPAPTPATPQPNAPAPNP
jgi:hypothetical protein